MFRCGLCKKKERYGGTRRGLRKHLRDEHRIIQNIANTLISKKGMKRDKRSWWIVEDFD